MTIEQFWIREISSFLRTWKFVDPSSMYLNACKYQDMTNAWSVWLPYGGSRLERNDEATYAHRVAVFGEMGTAPW